MARILTVSIQELNCPSSFASISVENAESFHSCLDVVARERRYLAQTRVLPLEKVQEFVEASVINDSVQFVALDGDRVVGWADIFPAWQDGISHRGSLGMGVLPNYRGQKIGETLLHSCLEKAKVKGITCIELETGEDNLPAIRLYEKFDFRLDCVKSHGVRFGGVYFATVQMSLVL